MKEPKKSSPGWFRIVLILLIAVLLATLLLLILELRKTDQAYEQAQETAGTFDEFREKTERNPDIIAWLKVDGTKIDTPVAQGADNVRYLTTDVEGNRSFTGCPFLDYRNSPEFTDVYSIIYGHHVEQHLMFGDLDLFRDPDFWKEERTGTLTLADGTAIGIRFFACVVTTSEDTRYFDPLRVRNNWEREFLDGLLTKAVYAGEPIGEEDRILALSTCAVADSKERILLLGKLE